MAFRHRQRDLVLADIGGAATVRLQLRPNVGRRARQKIGLGAIAAETDGGLVAGNDLCARQHQNGVATAFEGSLPHHVVAMALRRTGEEFHGQSAL
jgi:hypothetical protein